jgi:hypothetical protein
MQAPGACRSSRALGHSGCIPPLPPVPEIRNTFCNELRTVLDILQVDQRSSFTIAALDGLCSLMFNLLSFFDAEIWKQSTLAIFLALACW